MALAPLASLDDFTGWLGHPVRDDDAVRAGLVLVAVSALVRSEAGQTWEATPVPENARTVTLTVAARVFRNPEAATSYTVTTGPFGKTITFADPKGVGLFLTGEEKNTLRRLPGGATKPRGLFTLGTTRGEDQGLTFYVPTPDGQPFPWYADDVLP